MTESPKPESIEQALDGLADEFDLLDDWEERYRHVIDLGRALAPLTEAERSADNKVRGCASQVWLVTEPETGGRLNFRGDSDAHIVRGLIAIVLRLYSGQASADILAFDAKAAFGTLGLSGALSAQPDAAQSGAVRRTKARPDCRRRPAGGDGCAWSRRPRSWNGRG